jgi:asparagine synthase (glutamine-hydrolysing)
MCGLVGTYPAIRLRPLKTMLDRVAHRGPDGAGIWRAPRGTLGHARLAILDPEGGKQPLSDASHKYWIAFNGEIYNHVALRNRLTDRAFRTRTDTEVILHLYEAYGTEAVSMLDGMFAFALFDGEDLLLARDPLGIKPLYYGFIGRTLVFASEIKALQGLVPDIHEFPPGWWYHSACGWHQYFTLERLAYTDEPIEHPVEKIRETLTRAVEKRLMADVPVGVFLSGGLDSSIIAALAKEMLEDLDTFSVGVEGSADLACARQIAARLGTRHHEYVITFDEMAAALSDIIYHLESWDAALVRSAIPNYFLARLARDAVRVALCGEGADELYSGYAYLRRFTGNALHRELFEITGELHNTNLQRVDRMTMAHGIEGRVPFLDIDHLRVAFAIPPAMKLHGEKKTEKWVLRKAFEDILPDEVVWRTKAKFAKGCGTADLMQRFAEETVSDGEFEKAKREIYGVPLRSKEALLYYRHFQRHYDKAAIRTLGWSRSM